jgi:hypothetical protein
MTGRTKRLEKKYRIIMSFTYKGPKGKWKPSKHVRIGPGQEIPELESHELQRLLHEGKIAEVGSDGQNIANKRFVEMNAEQIEKMLTGKPELAVMNIVRASDFGSETLNRILVFCERNRLNQAAHFVDEKLTAVAA